MPQREAPLPLHILLVEDSEHDVLAFRRAFQKALAPCDLALCERAEEALAQLCGQAAAFDLVVADYKLPGMSGLELYRALRASHIPIPLVLLTGAGTEYLAVEALKAGVDD
jgi:CheY-like chemotaxis protein